MKRSALFLLLISGTAACGTSRVPYLPPPESPAKPVPAWSLIAVTDISDRGVRQAVTDLLRLVDSDFLWPELTLGDHGVIIIDTNNPQQPLAYCVGICEPEVTTSGGTSRLWRSTPPEVIGPGNFRFVSRKEWGLPGPGDVVAVGFESRESSVATAVHEDFHLNYESRYALAFGDEIGIDRGGQTPATRANLASTYSQSAPARAELHEECAALVAALQAGSADRPAAFAALRRFSSIRDSRRARPGAPSFEEDFWERQEGIPTNLERRAAVHMQFRDPSVIGATLTPRGCDMTMTGGYFLVLGALQAAILDTFSDPAAWPALVYPRDKTPASSLYLLVQALFSQFEER